MDKNTIIIGLLTLIVGFGGGYVVASGRGSDDNYRDMNSMMGAGSGMSGAMAGMMSGLNGKTGDDFDKAFLSEMIVHHQGAVQMAQAALSNAKHAEIKQLAQGIINAQTSEITQMQQWQKTWYGQ